MQLLLPSVRVVLLSLRGVVGLILGLSAIFSDAVMAAEPQRIFDG